MKLEDLFPLVLLVIGCCITTISVLLFSTMACEFWNIDPLVSIFMGFVVISFVVATLFLIKLFMNVLFSSLKL